MTFDTAMFIVCILVINTFIFAAMRSPRICAIIFGALLSDIGSHLEIAIITIMVFILPVLSLMKRECTSGSS